MTTPSWDAAIALCLTRLASERRFSAHTVAAYRRDLERLSAFARARACPSPDQMTGALARDFVASLSRSGLGGRSIARALSAARTLYRECAIPGSPFRAVRAPKSPRRLPADLSVDALAGFLHAPARTPIEVRDLALVELFYGAGLRLSELVNLKVTELDLGQGLVRVLGKGQRERVVPIGAGAEAALRAWLPLRAASEPLGPLFPGRGGRPLSARAIQKRLAWLARARGLGVPLHPHMLRHSFASHVLQSSGDLRAVQELLGHKNLTTTQIYTHLDFQRLAAVYDQTHPRARRKTR